MRKRKRHNTGNTTYGENNLRERQGRNMQRRKNRNTDNTQYGSSRSRSRQNTANAYLRTIYDTEHSNNKHYKTWNMLNTGQLQTTNTWKILAAEINTENSKHETMHNTEEAQNGKHARSTKIREVKYMKHTNNGEQVRTLRIRERTKYGKSKGRK